MRELKVKIGKNFGDNQWQISFFNETHCWHFALKEPFELSYPFPGAIMNEEEVNELSDFLQQTLKEQEENEQDNLE